MFKFRAIMDFKCRYPELTSICLVFCVNGNLNLDLLNKTSNVSKQLESKYSL